MSYCKTCRGQGKSQVTYFINLSDEYDPFKPIAYQCSCGGTYKNKNYEIYVSRVSQRNRETDRMSDVPW